MSIWQNYISTYRSMLPCKIENLWASWQAKGTSLNAIDHSHPYLLKSRQVDISDGKNVDIFNCIAYPKTGSNLPCFGMDLMGFFEQKVIIVFDFQHPVEKFVFSVDGLPKAEKDYRFFEMGNHFSENIFVRYCTFDEVDNYLPDFRNYLETYRKMVDEAQPTGEDLSFYKDFDVYMKKLDPILGYMSSRFGKENANRMMDEFFFSYAE